MSTSPATQLWLQLTTRSVPPVPPLDADTGELPAIWRGEDVDFRLGVFDRFGQPQDLSNLAFLEVDIFPLLIPGPQPDTNQGYGAYTIQPYPTTAPAPLISKTIPASSITALISTAAWESGDAQNAIASFTWEETASLELAGLPNRSFGLVVHGITTAGRKITYAGGSLNVFEAGEQGIYLPTNIVPLDVPASTILYVQPNQQLLFSETISVEGLVEIDGLLVQV